MSEPVEIEASETASGDMYGSWVNGDEISTGDEWSYLQTMVLEFEPAEPIPAGTVLDAADLEITFSQDNEYNYPPVEMTTGIATDPEAAFPANYTAANALTLEPGANVVIPTIAAGVDDTFQIDPESEDPAFSVSASLAVTVLAPDFTANQSDLDDIIADFLAEFPLVVEGESLSFTVTKTNGVSPSIGCLITISADYFPDEVGTDQLLISMQKDGPGVIFISVPLADAGGLIPASDSNSDFEVTASFDYELTGVSHLDGHVADSGQEWDTKSPDDFLLLSGRITAKSTAETVRSCITPGGSSIVGTYSVDVLPTGALTGDQKEHHAIIFCDRSGSGYSYLAAVELTATTIEVAVEVHYHDPELAWWYRPTRYSSGAIAFAEVPDFPVGGLRSETRTLQLVITSGGAYTATYMGLTATWSLGSVLEFTNTGLMTWNPTGVYSELSNFSFVSSGPSYENAGDKQTIDVKDLIQSQIDALDEEETLDRVMLVFKMTEESSPAPHYIHGAGAVSGAPKLKLMLADGPPPTSLIPGVITPVVVVTAPALIPLPTPLSIPVITITPIITAPTLIPRPRQPWRTLKESTTSTLYKNQSGQKWLVRAWDAATGLPKTGDAANITATIRKDNAAGVATNDEHPTEISVGYYAFDMDQPETNYNRLDLIPVSATTGVIVIPVNASQITVTDPGAPQVRIALNATGVRIWLETAAGEFIDVTVLDEEATAELIIRELDSETDLLEVEVPQSNAGFEATFEDPGFAAGSMYRFLASVIINGITHQVQTTRNGS